MCGIFGYYHRDGKSLSAETLKAMGHAIRHRGPDDQGIYSGNGFALGNQRLSIIDLAGGHQPFVSDDGQIVVVQNGEIFNHIELAQALAKTGYKCRTHSDTEVLLRMYEQEGISFVSKLNGMFAIAIYDAREQAMYLIRDRIGVKPLYVHDDGVQLTFGSEIKSLLSGISQLGIDVESIHHYLAFNYIPPPWTVWEGVRHVMPGTWIKFTRHGTVRTERWWSLADQCEQHYDFGAWQEEFLSILDDATRIRLRADVPWGAFLSGGVDSSTIVALMARHVSAPVKTFCIGFDDPRFDESPFAADAARRFGCDHSTEIAELNMLESWPLVLHHLDQPHGDASFMPTLRVSRLAAKQVKVVLTGDGGDELFAGYEKYEHFFSQSDVHTIDDASFHRRYFDSISLFTSDARMALYQPEVAARLAGLDSLEIVAKPWFDEASHFDRINQALYLDMQLLLSGNNLVKPDRMGMAVSIEARTPFLDWRMMELAFRSRGFTKLSPEGDKKHWFKKAVTPLIGEDLAYRKKQMFTVPVGEWFRKESYDWLSYTLNRSELLSQLFRPEVVAGLLESHRNGRANYTRELRALAALALWYEGLQSCRQEIISVPSRCDTLGMPL